MPPFASFADLRAVCLDLPGGHPAASSAVAMREDTLTKPPKSLGRLEEITAFLAHWQGHAPPRLERTEVLVFAGNHGVTAQGVSAYPAEVTGQMVANLSHGGAAINQLARAAGASLRVIPLELETPTADFTESPALGEAEFIAAVATGYDVVEPESDLLCLGEMGIGNTTAASAIAAALFGGGGERWAGRGTGVDDLGLARKRDVIDRALVRHAALLHDPLRIAAAFGGRELAAILGAARRAAPQHPPAARRLCLHRRRGAALQAAHRHAQPRARRPRLRRGRPRALLDELNLKPLLDLDMRLGEASGAATALLILRAALACHTGMATFAEAGVSDKPADEAAEPKAAG